MTTKKTALGEAMRSGVGSAAIPAPAPLPRTSNPNPGARVQEVKAPGVGHADIAKAAYFRWLRQGGDALGNWLAAEAELRRGSARVG